MADLIAMLAAAAGNAGEDVDPDFANTVLLLHGDGTNGAQNNTFLDASTNNFTITRNGNTTQGTFSPFSKPDGRWGNYFDGASDDLKPPSNTAFNPSGQDITVDFFIYMTGYAAAFNVLFDLGSNVGDMQCGVTNTGEIRFQLGGAIGSVKAGFTLNTWHYVTCVKSGTDFTIYLDAVAGTTVTRSPNSTTQLTFGAGVQGYLSNFRYVRGSAIVPTSVPTSPLTAVTNTSLLTCQSNRFIDNSSNAFAITRTGDVKVTPFSPFPITTAYDPSVNGGAGYFDGSGDFLTAPSNASLQLGNGNFTAEAWIYITGTNIIDFGYGILGTYNDILNGGWSLAVNRSTGGPYGIYFILSNAIQGSFGTYLPNGEWHHIAVVRSGSATNNTSLFLNGSRVAQFTNTTNDTVSSTLWLGAMGGNRGFPGYISNARFVKGTAVYSGATYTVPTSPFTAITNTSLLCNFTNAGILDNTCFNALETVGNAQIDTSVKKYGTGSLDFAANDGTAYLLLPASDNTALGGDFTVEFWLNPDTVTTSYANSSLATLLDSDAATGTGTEWWAIHQINNTLQFVHNGTDRLTSDAELTASVWQHCAFVRSGSTLTCYIDGVAEGSTTYSTAINGSRKLYIAKQPGASRFYKGYIDDLRITKGIARYTTTFTPPTKAFPDLGE